MLNGFSDVDTSDEHFISQRRNFLKMGLAGIVGSMVPFIGAKNVLAAASDGDAWKIAFRNTHTGESFSGVYRVGDKYLPDAFKRINYVLRDFRTSEVFPMDPYIIDILSDIHRRSDAIEPFDVLSGYRSPKTNSMLKRKTNGVAKNSFHMYGQAIDIRLPKHSSKKLRNIAESLKFGGVGYYPRSDFVHIDTGTVRSWIS